MDLVSYPKIPIFLSPRYLSNFLGVVNFLLTFITSLKISLHHGFIVWLVAVSLTLEIRLWSIPLHLSILG